MFPRPSNVPSSRRSLSKRGAFSNHGARFLALLSLGSFLFLGACGGGAKSGATAQFGGNVVARAEGFSSRPDWADPNQPLRQNGSALSFIGSVVIAGDQSVQMGYRASDSYARAELLRFLKTRVVAILYDTESTNPEKKKLEEVLDQSAEALIDDWSIEAHYWEKRESDGKENVAVFSRLDVDAKTLAELFARVAERNPDLDLRALPKKVEERFGKLAKEAEAWNEAGPVAPGVTQPAWAKAGDAEDGDGFTFVCQGTADEEDKAFAVASARCNEKLCRLFGVSLKSRLSVKENLEGLEAESEVSETCDVRVQGRKTVNKGGECGPDGCTYWVRQTYPRASYDEEKARLASPTILTQQVVIQEGDKHYKDPAVCEQNLRDYGKVPGADAAAFKARKALLTKALGSCDGIDGRDSGLFITLNTLLTTPLEQFSLAINDGQRLDYQTSDRFAFTLAPTSFRRSLETDRFLTQRIAKMVKFIDGAILPLTLLELAEKGGTAAQVDDAMAQVVRYPFVNEPATVHHRYYIHDLALSIGRRGKAPLSKRYRDFLLAQVEKGNFSCSYRKNIPGERIIGYFGYDGILDEDEWRAALKIASSGEPSESSSCFEVMTKPLTSGDRSARLELMARNIASGTWASKDEYKLFDSFLGRLKPEERLPFFLRYEGQLSGKSDAKEDLTSDVVKAAFGWDWDYVNGKPEEKRAGVAACGAMGKNAGTFFRDHPDAKPSDAGFCLCLRVEGLSPPERRALVEQLVLYGDETCHDIRPEDWPEEYYAAKTPETAPYPYDTGPAFEDREPLHAEVKSCFDQHSFLKYSDNVETYLTATSVRGKLQGAKAVVTIGGELKSLERKEKRRGYIHASELKAMKTKLEECIATAANSYSLSESSSAAKSSKPVRIWIQFFAEHSIRNGYVK